MTTLIRAADNSGEIGRCDAKCYDAAPGTSCNCICGGVNHAVGKARAIEQTRADAERLINTAGYRLAPEAMQQTLFDLPACEPHQAAGSRHDGLKV